MTDAAATDPTQPMEPDASLGDLLGRLSNDFGQLVGAQVDLAKAELKEEAAQATRAASLLGGAAIAALVAVLLLSMAAAWGLAEIMEPGFAFLVVGALWALGAAVAAMTGRRRMQEVGPPPRTTETLKEDMEWARQRTT